MSTIIKLAYHEPTQKVIHIDHALRGLACNCTCFVCREELQAIKGEERTHHFRHNNNENCVGGLETALHKLAKQILVKNIQITIPKYGKVNYKEAVSEKAFEERTPDVTAKLLSSDELVFFEICCMHEVVMNKLKVLF